MSQIVFDPTPEARSASQVRAFIDQAAARYGAPSDDVEAFHTWSTEHIEDFWTLLLESAGVIYQGETLPVLTSLDIEHAKFFPRLSLSYAENLLQGDPESLAIIATNENGIEQTITRGELKARVLAAAQSLRELELSSTDRVVAIAANRIDTVIACLAATTVGACWSLCGPEMGTQAICERFERLKPKILFHHSSYSYQGKTIDLGPKVREICERLPDLRYTVTLGDEPLTVAPRASTLTLDSLWRRPTPNLDTAFPRFPFDHPLFILFTSGTTGRPKCLVHGVGGTLLAHAMEHRLHNDLTVRDRFYYQTSCSWMMWNWTLSALATGATLVLYDGSPTYPLIVTPWQICDRFEVTVFGTSPTFLGLCQAARLSPSSMFDVSALRTILSTGSILSDSAFHWVRDFVRPDLPLCSVSGGTDLVGMFLQSHPLLPVRVGELQSKNLAMDVRALNPDEAGRGELVCAKPFPNRPVAIFGDEQGRTLHEAYYAANPGYWTHGDLLEETGTGFRLHGRSDGIMNIRGVRIGPAEIYRALERVPEVEDALAVERPAPNGNAVTLLVVLREGAALDETLRGTVRSTIREACSQVHVPTEIVAVSGVPYTYTGKKSERSVTDLVVGRPVQNRDALRNPESLVEIGSALGLPA